MKKRLVIVFGLLLAPVLTFAYTNPGRPTGFVNDFAHVLSQADKQKLESKLSALDSATGNQVVVALLPSLGGDTIENFAVKLFSDWKIGNERLDNGALILVALEDREIRIEVGYGLEPTLTDIVSAHIIVEDITPAFKQGNYALGLSNGVDRIISVIGGEVIPETSQKKIDWVPIIVWIIFIIVLSIIRNKRNKSFIWIGGPPMGGGRGGGFGGFGGGMSGGGGASGKW